MTAWAGLTVISLREVTAWAGLIVISLTEVTTWAGLTVISLIEVTAWAGLTVISNSLYYILTWVTLNLLHFILRSFHHL